MTPQNTTFVSLMPQDLAWQALGYRSNRPYDQPSCNNEWLIVFMLRGPGRNPRAPYKETPFPSRGYRPTTYKIIFVTFALSFAARR